MRFGVTVPMQRLHLKGKVALQALAYGERSSLWPARKL